MRIGLALDSRLLDSLRREPEKLTRQTESLGRAGEGVTERDLCWADVPKPPCWDFGDAGEVEAGGKNV